MSTDAPTSSSAAILAGRGQSDRRVTQLDDRQADERQELRSWVQIGRRHWPGAVARLTARQRVLPTFLLAGAEKSGTTSLFAYLAANPGVLPAKVKEPRYFSREYHRGLLWYRSFFPLSPVVASTRRRLGVEPAVGEGSQILWHPHAPARAHVLNHAMRLIVLLRDPVDRAYSEFQMKRHHNKGVSFEEAIELEEERTAGELERMESDPSYYSFAFERYAYLARGRYLEQLERWLRFFPREQLLVLVTDDLRADPAGTVATTLRFLGLPSRGSVRYDHQRVGDYREPLAPETRERLAQHFAEPNRRLYEFLGRDLGWTRPGQ